MCRGFKTDTKDFSKEHFLIRNTLDVTRCDSFRALWLAFIQTRQIPDPQRGEDLKSVAVNVCQSSSRQILPISYQSRWIAPMVHQLTLMSICFFSNSKSRMNLLSPILNFFFYYYNSLLLFLPLIQYWSYYQSTWWLRTVDLLVSICIIFITDCICKAKCHFSCYV